MCVVLILQQKGVKSVKYDKRAQNRVKKQQKTSTGHNIVLKKHRIAPKVIMYLFYDESVQVL